MTLRGDSLVGLLLYSEGNREKEFVSLGKIYGPEGVLLRGQQPLTMPTPKASDSCGSVKENFSEIKCEQNLGRTSKAIQQCLYCIIVAFYLTRLMTHTNNLNVYC